MTDTAAQLRRQILDLTAQYWLESSRASDFIPGVSPVPVSGKVIDGSDVSAVVDSALDAWFTTGRFGETFERDLARFVGVRSASLVNSGSSANLVALSALTSPKLGDRRLRPGDEVITVAAGFPDDREPHFPESSGPGIRGRHCSRLRDRCAANWKPHVVTGRGPYSSLTLWETSLISMQSAPSRVSTIYG